MIPRCCTALAAPLLIAVLTRPAGAYDPSTTHPGLSARAALQSERLHRFLKDEAGLPLGLFAELTLAPSLMDRREYSLLRLRCDRLDPAGGYNPVEDRLRAAGWLLAGTVLADMPASANRNHFYSPVLHTGLQNGHFLLSPLFSLLGAIEGGDSVLQLLTSSGFDLTGTSALRWIRATDNDQSTQRFYAHLERGISAPQRAQREHHLALALQALGGLLGVLQDMATPTQVRNDYVGGRVQRLGSSTFDRGSRYEVWVARVYGQQGVPRGAGQPPRFARLTDFFTNTDWSGLADRTATACFSPGTLPAPVQLPVENPKALPARLNAALPFSEPRISPLDLECAATRTCYLQGPQGPRLAYRIDTRRQVLHFALDERVFAATARQLLPLAVTYSTGAIDFALRGKLEAHREADGRIALINRGPRLRHGKLTLFSEAADGTRRSLGSTRAQLPAPAGARLALLDQPALPANAAHVVALFTGIDHGGEQILAAVRFPASMPAAAASRPTSRPVWQEAVDVAEPDRPRPDPTARSRAASLAAEPSKPKQAAPPATEPSSTPSKRPAPAADPAAE